MTGSCSDVGPMVDTILVNCAVHFPLRDASVAFIVLLAMSDSVDVVDDVDVVFVLVDVESDIVSILGAFVADGKAEAVSLLALLREVISCFDARVNIFVNVEGIMEELRE